MSGEKPMTEPQKMGIQEVMNLVDDFGGISCGFGQHPDEYEDRYSPAREAVIAALTAIIDDRDALRERVLALERAIKSGMEMAGDPSTCHFCGTLWSINDHAPDCIIRTLPKEPQ